MSDDIVINDTAFETLHVPPVPSQSDPLGERGYIGIKGRVGVAIELREGEDPMAAAERLADLVRDQALEAMKKHLNR